MTNEAVIREVFSDEVFVKVLLTMETPAEVQQALRQKDITFSGAASLGGLAYCTDYLTHGRR